MNFSPAALYRFGTAILDANRRLSKLDRISMLSQAMELIRLKQQNSLEPHEYYRYELCRTDIPWEAKQRYMSRRQSFLMHRTINQMFDHGAVTKLSFYRMAEHLGLPVPKLYAIYDEYCGRDNDGETICDRRRFVDFFERSSFDEFVLKPTHSAYGDGVRICKKTSTGKVFSSVDGEVTYGELFDRINDKTYGNTPLSADTWLIQEKLQQHPFLNRYSTSCTQTARVVTYITKRGDIQVLMKLLKIGRGKKYTDNVGTTGMAVEFDDNGRLSKAAQLTENGVAWRSEHPDTGARIESEMLPFHREVIDIAIKGQSRLAFLRSLGWDIAITEKGPVLLEANVYWSHILQFAVGRGVMTDELYEEIHEFGKA